MRSLQTIFGGADLTVQASQLARVHRTRDGSRHRSLLRATHYDLVPAPRRARPRLRPTTRPNNFCRITKDRG